MYNVYVDSEQTDVYSLVNLFQNNLHLSWKITKNCINLIPIKNQFITLFKFIADVIHLINMYNVYVDSEQTDVYFLVNLFQNNYIKVEKLQKKKA